MIRSATVSDVASLAELWRAAGLRHPELTERELASSLRPDLVLVEEDAAGEITGTVFGTFDGVRGWVRRLATRPDRRGRGIATALLAELERRLIADGCPKVNLLIEPENAAVGPGRPRASPAARLLTRARPAARTLTSGVPLTGCGTPLRKAGVYGATAAPRARPRSLTGNSWLVRALVGDTPRVVRER